MLSKVAEVAGLDEGVNEPSIEHDPVVARLKNLELFSTDMDRAGGDKAVKK
jgi:hypothetical protein